METKVNYYEVLGVAVDATQGEIKAAYRKRAQVTHPDTQDFAAQINPKLEFKTDDFKLISEAYHVLKDPGARAEYTKYGMLNPEYKAAVKVLQNSLIGIVANLQPGYILDPIIQLRANTGEYLDNLQNERRDTLNTAKLYASVQRKIKVKSKLSRNIFNEGLDGLQDRISERLEKIDSDINTAEKMLEILDYYEYENMQFFPLSNPVEC